MQISIMYKGEMYSMMNPMYSHLAVMTTHIAGFVSCISLATLSPTTPNELFYFLLHLLRQRWLMT